jgi:hypothetical protein
MYPVNDWNDAAAFGEEYKGKNTIVSVVEFFQTAYSNTLQALKDYDSPDNAWSADTVQGFTDWTLDGEALRTVYPMRSLPFCGVAETAKGDLKPYGGFASLIEPWAWDDGSVRKAIKESVARRKS